MKPTDRYKYLFGFEFECIHSNREVYENTHGYHDSPRAFDNGDTYNFRLERDSSINHYSDREHDLYGYETEVINEKPVTVEEIPEMVNAFHRLMSEDGNIYKFNGSCGVHCNMSIYDTVKKEQVNILQYFPYERVGELQKLMQVRLKARGFTKGQISKFNKHYSRRHSPKYKNKEEYDRNKRHKYGELYYKNRGLVEYRANHLCHTSTPSEITNSLLACCEAMKKVFDVGVNLTFIDEQIDFVYNVGEVNEVHRRRITPLNIERSRGMVSMPYRHAFSLSGYNTSSLWYQRARMQQSYDFSNLRISNPTEW